jgi:hypothetical protein
MTVLRAWFRGPVGWGRFLLLLLLGGGLATLALAGLDDRIVARQRRTFVKVPCFMEFATVTRERGRDARNMPGWIFVPAVQYRYEYGGVPHESDVVCSRSKPLTSESAAEQFIKRFGPGTTAECYVNPDDPAQAMLELPTNEGARVLGRFGLLAAALAAIALAALQVATTLDIAPRRTRPRSPGWGERDSGPNDPLRRTREMLKDRLES